jgi:hypothetical protein
MRKKCNSTFVLHVFKTHGCCKASEESKAYTRIETSAKKTKKELGISKKRSLG